MFQHYYQGKMENNQALSQPRKNFFFYLTRGFFIIIACFLLLIVLNFEKIFLDETKNLNSIGVLKLKDGTIRIRRPGDPNWEALKINDFIPAKSMVLSSKNSTATYVLLDGTVINQNSETLLKLDFEIESLDPVIAKLSIDLNRGGVDINTPAAISEDDFRTLHMNSKKFMMNHPKKSKVKFNKEPKQDSLKLSVIDGQISVRSGKKYIDVKEGEEIRDLTKERVETESPENMKQQIPEELLAQYRQEAKKENYENLQQEVYGARSLEKILERIFSAIFY